MLALLHMTLPPEQPKSASEATVWLPTTQKTPPLAISKDVAPGKTRIRPRCPTGACRRR